MALCWHGDLKKHICGLVLPSSSCYNDFRRFLPAITLYIHEAYYGSGLVDDAIPAMFRERVTSLVLVAAEMDSASGAKMKAVHLRRLKVFPKLSSVEVLPVLY